MCPYLFLFLILFFATNSEARKSLEERYIDLLPEGDKLVFLEKVARRIQDEVKPFSDVKPNQTEITLEEKDLEPHKQYVNKVLKEEAIKFVEQKETRRADNDTSDESSQTEQSTDNGADRRTTSEDLTLREKHEEVSNIEVLSDSISNNSGVNKVVTDSNIPVTDLLLSDNNKTIASKEFVKDIKQNVDESKIGEGIPKEVSKQQINTFANVPSKAVKSTKYRTNFDSSNEYLSENDKTLYGEERKNKKKDLSRQFRYTHGPNDDVERVTANIEEDGNYLRTLKEHEVYEIDQNERKDTVLYYPHQEKLKTLNEEPYYIPVYNYDTHNAFYSAKNRLGPNEDNIENADVFEDEKQYERNGDHYNLNLDYEIDIPQKKINQDRYHMHAKHLKKLTGLSDKRIITTKKPIPDNEYFDLDYYFGRNFDNDEENISKETTGGNMKSKILNGRFKVIGNGKGLHKVNPMVPEEDELNMKTKNEKILTFIKVINDMIIEGSETLVKYDWLGTTIDILAAADKLKTVLREDRLGLRLNSQDQQLLRYVKYLFENAKYPQSLNNIDDYNKEYDNNGNENVERLDNQERIPQFLVDVAKVYAKLSLTEDTDEVFNKNWKDVTGQETSHKVKSDLKSLDRNVHKELENLIMDVERNLYGLHTTIRDIAINTKYKDLDWFNDIKEKYLRILTREKSLQILLHIMSAGLLDLIEGSADNRVEFNFEKYIRNNDNEVAKTIQRFKTVISLVDELNA